MPRTLVVWSALAVTVLALAVIVATRVTPWPGVLVIRAVFDREAGRASAALAPLVPDEVRVEAGLSYDPADRDALFDIYRGPGATPAAPTVVWFHGGGFVSGRRGAAANYLKILAGHGYNVVNVGYSLAPRATYPTPIRQANTALAFLDANAERLRLNTDRIVLSGSSAGAQIAAQTATMLANPAYGRTLGIAPGMRANQLAGAMLYCGVFDVTAVGNSGGILGWFVHSMAWAYSGRRDWRNADGFESMSIAPHLVPTFPPTFISVGNADPLAPQSIALADELAGQGVEVARLFFEADHEPPLPHEFQFNLGSEAGRTALERSVRWLGSLQQAPAP